jgi:hypothetical protein
VVESRTYDTTIPSINFQMPPPLGQHVQTNSLFTDGDDGEDMKMPQFEKDGGSFGDATHVFGEEADDVTLSDLGSCAMKDGMLTYQFVAGKATSWNSLPAEFGMGIVLRWCHLTLLCH